MAEVPEKKGKSDPATPGVPTEMRISVEGLGKVLEFCPPPLVENLLLDGIAVYALVHYLQSNPPEMFGALAFLLFAAWFVVCYQSSRPVPPE